MQTRRHFLRAALGGPLLLSLAPTVPLILTRSAAHAASLPAPVGRVLVVIQLTGGNDGLNTVVPFEDDAYARSRPTLRLKASEVRKLNAQLGLHPRMAGFERLFKEGQLGIWQGVGCAGLSRNHETALLAWQTAAPDPGLGGPGWLGLATDHLWQTSRPAAPGVFVGDIARPFAINAGSAVVPALHDAHDASAGVSILAGGLPVPSASEPGLAPLPSQPLLAHVQASLALARSRGRRIEDAGRASPNATYPACGLGQDLRTVAQLVRAETGIRIFHVELGGGGIGGFDNHANQLGNHCALLEQLSESVAAFAADLAADRLLDRVLLLTFSEFGRTVAENGRRGTDHGAAGPMFLVGGNVRAGIHGAHPSLTDLDGDALKPGIDFRSVYAAVLEDWLSLPGAAILGGRFERPALLAST
jgi:uncharacterized protein (DUF1501 family)